MDFITACCAIEITIENRPTPTKIRNNIIDYILREVARKSGKDLANSLILKYNLNYGLEGGHKWFDDEETKGQYRPIRDPNKLDLIFEENWYFSDLTEDDIELDGDFVD